MIRRFLLAAIVASLIILSTGALTSGAPDRAPDRAPRDPNPPSKPSDLFREHPPEPPPPDTPSIVHPPPTQHPPARPAGSTRNPPAPAHAAPPSAPASAPQNRPTRHPIPSPASRARSLQLLHDLFADEYRKAQTSPDDAKELTNELLRQSESMRRRTTPDDIASRYVLLTEIISLSASHRDYDSALRAARDLSDAYDIDGPALKLDLVARGSRDTTDPVRLEPLIRAVFEVSDDLLAAADLPGAAATLTQADSLARRSKDVSLATEVQRRRRDVRDLQAEYRTLAASLEALRRNPDDPAANLVVGRFRCLVAGDFAAGLPLLAKSTDAQLGPLAARDLRNPTTPDQRADLADAWWALSDQHTGRAQQNLRARSARWYRQAVAGLGGLKRTLAEKRIAAAPPPDESDPPPRLTPGPVVVTTEPPPNVRAPGTAPRTAPGTSPNTPPGVAPDTTPDPGPAEPGDRLLQLLATKFPPDLRPIPGQQWLPTKADAWFKTNLRPGTPVTANVQLQSNGSLQRHPATKKPYVYVTFRVPTPVTHDQIQHNLDIAVRLEDQKALDAVTIAQGQRGQLTGTVTDLRLGGWSGNKDRGLGSLTFMLMLDNVRFTPAAE